MRDAAIAALACPMCGDGLDRDDASLRCQAGHTFDIARSGCVSMLMGAVPGAAADTISMVRARERLLGAGHLEPLTRALGRAATRGIGRPGRPSRVPSGLDPRP